MTHINGQPDQPFEFKRGSLERAAGNIQTAFEQFQPTAPSPQFAGPAVDLQGIQQLRGLQGQIGGAPDVGQTAGFITGLEGALGFQTPQGFAEAARRAGLSQIAQGQQVAEQRALQTLGPSLARSGTAGATIGTIGTQAGQQRLNLELAVQQQLAEQQLSEQAQQRQFALGLLPQFRQAEQLQLQGALGLAGQELPAAQFAQQRALTEFGLNQFLPAQEQRELEAQRLQAFLDLSLAEPGLAAQERAGRRGLIGTVVGDVLDIGGEILGAFS